MLKSSLPARAVAAVCFLTCSIIGCRDSLNISQCSSIDPSNPEVFQQCLYGSGSFGKWVVDEYGLPDYIRVTLESRMKTRGSSRPLKRSSKARNHMLFKRAAIIGTGQIGGSLGWALRKNGIAMEVVGAGRTIKNLRTALSMGLICSYALTPEKAVKGADLVVFATPVSTIPVLIRSLADVIGDISKKRLATIIIKAIIHRILRLDLLQLSIKLFSGFDVF
jgi:hypothetical protein